MMRAQLLVEPGHLSLRDVPTPSAGPGEVVLRVRAGLTCGTDVKALLRGHPKFPMPGPFGHEYSGEVAEVGAGVVGFRPGQGIMAVPTAPCGECFYCARSDENLCEALWRDYVLGGYGEYLKLPARVVRQNLYPKPADLSFAEAALLEPLSCVMHGLEMLPIRPEWSVVVIGAGALGLLHVLALRAAGVSRVFVIARGARRSAAAAALGAQEFLTDGAAEAAAKVRSLTGGYGADLVVECTGHVEVWEAAPALARKGGWVVLFGGCPVGTKVSFDTNRLHYDQIRLLSPFHFTPRAVRRAYELLARSEGRTRPLISGELPLTALAEALRRHQHGEGIKWAVIP